MNALEKLEKQESEIKVLAERLFEVQDALQRVMPIMDALVAIVGKDKVLEVAAATASKQRDEHVKMVLKACEEEVTAGLAKEVETVEEGSLLFIKENEDESLRLLPIPSIAEQSVRELLIGSKVGGVITISGMPKITIERAFTPVQQSVEE